MPNYGAQGNSKVDEYYMCVSPGVFVSVGTMHLGKIENHLYVPAGYKYKNGKIKKA